MNGNIDYSKPSIGGELINLDPNYIVYREGQLEADEGMAIKFGDKRVSVSRPSKIIWIGVLLVKENSEDWIHTAVGLHNNITVKFKDGSIINYQYLVIHGVADKEKRIKIHLNFANNLCDIYSSFAQLFNRKVTYSVVAGTDEWPNRCFGNARSIRKMESFLGLTLNMRIPGYGETNCVHFAVFMFLYFAGEDENKWREIVGKFYSDIRNNCYISFLCNLQRELDKI